MVIFHSYVSLPEGIWSYDHMIIDDMFGVWLRKKRGRSIRQQRTWLGFFPLSCQKPSPNTTRPQLCCITALMTLSTVSAL